MAAAEAGAALAAHSIDFIDEDDAGGVLLALFKEVAHTGGTDAHKHFHEVGAGNGEEGYASLTGHSAREKRLAGAWRADEQDAFGNTGTESCELLGIGEELHDFGELFLGFINAGDVSECHALLVVLVEKLGAGTAEAEGPAAGSALHLAHEVDPHADKEKHGEPGHQHADVPGLVVRGLGLDLNLLLKEVRDHLVIAGSVRGETLSIAADGADFLSLNGDRGDLTRVNAGHKVAV